MPVLESVKALEDWAETRLRRVVKARSGDNHNILNFVAGDIRAMSKFGFWVQRSGSAKPHTV
jgi:hypothetical protein